MMRTCVNAQDAKTKIQGYNLIYMIFRLGDIILSNYPIECYVENYENINTETSNCINHEKYSLLNNR